MINTRIRTEGSEQPFIAAGIFKIRLPYLHFGLTKMEILLAIVSTAVLYALIPLIKDVFQVSTEVAIGLSFAFHLIYFIGVLLGDNFIYGWVTPSIPLTLVFLKGFESVPDRVHALLAIQIGLGILMVVLGITGLGKRFVDLVPNSVKAGIVLGAGIAALYGEFKTGGRFYSMPVSMTIALGLSIILIYSKFLQPFKNPKYKIIFQVAQFSIIPGIVFAWIVGWNIGEISLPKFSGSFFTGSMVPWAEMLRIFSPIFVGLPPLKIWLSAIPMILAIYIIAFSDIIVGTKIIEQYSENRKDEFIDINPNRTNIIVGIRNLITSLFLPWIGMAGPLWTGTQVVLYQRWTMGKQVMYSIYDALGTLTFGIVLFSCLWPLVCIVVPGAPIGLMITMVLTGYACISISMAMTTNNEERIVAAFTGLIVFTQGVGWGMLIGIISYLIIEHPWFRNKINKIAVDI